MTGRCAEAAATPPLHALLHPTSYVLPLASYLYLSHIYLTSFPVQAAAKAELLRSASGVELQLQACKAAS